MTTASAPSGAEERTEASAERPKPRAGRNVNGATVGDLLKDLRDDGVQLMREEIALATTEMSEKLKRTGRNTGYLVTGGFIAYGGFLLLLVSAAAGLALGLRALGTTTQTAVWLAPLIIGIVVAVIGGVFMKKAVSTLKKESIVPKQTIASVKETNQWVRNKMT